MLRKPLLLLIVLLAIMPAGNTSSSDEKTADYDLTIAGKQAFTFENSECEKTGTCSLKRVDFLAESYRMEILADQEPAKTATYGTRVTARYRTDSVSAIESYAFVQFIRGCVFETYRRDGRSMPVFSVARRHFDPNAPVIFRHPAWTIDTDNPDPVYSSMPLSATDLGCSTDAPSPYCSLSRKEARFFFLRWDNKPDLMERSMEHYYGIEKPAEPEVYITDHPSQASFYSSQYDRSMDSARNVSLEFRTCLYRAADVPTVMSPSDPVDFAQPLVCFNWSSSYLYNWPEARYEQPVGIVQECK